MYLLSYNRKDASSVPRYGWSRSRESSWVQRPATLSAIQHNLLWKCSYMCGSGWDQAELRMRSSRVVRVSDFQCPSCNGPGFDPSIRRHSGIRVAADEAVLNIVGKKLKNPPQKYLKYVLQSARRQPVVDETTQHHGHSRPARLHVWGKLNNFRC